MLRSSLPRVAASVEAAGRALPPPPRPGPALTMALMGRPEQKETRRRMIHSSTNTLKKAAVEREAKQEVPPLEEDRVEERKEEEEEEDEGEEEEEEMGQTLAPGVPVLDVDEWERRLASRPVEFNDDKGERALGLLLRPQGKRWWWVLDSKGRELRLNRYQVTFLWPLLDEQQGRAEFRKADLAKIEAASSALLGLIDAKFEAKVVWNALKREYKLQPVAGYHLARYLSSKDSATFSFNADLIFASHRWLSKEAHYFKRASIHGWRCLDTATATLHAKRHKETLEEAQARERFLAKIRTMLGIERERREIAMERERRRAVVGVAAPSEADLAEREAKLEEQETALRFDKKHDANFLQLIKQYSLTTNEFVDGAIAEHFLKPLGFGSLPHDAFELLVALGIYHRYDNPHILRTELNLDEGLKEAEVAAKNLLKNGPDEDELEGVRRNLTSHAVFVLTEEKDAVLTEGLSYVQEADGSEWVWHHVTDASRYVSPHTTLDLVARKRATAIPLPERHVPMLPPRLAPLLTFEQSSPEDLKPAFSVGMRLFRDGSVESFVVVPSFVRRIHALTFDEMDAILLGEKETSLSAKAKEVREKHMQTWAKLEELAEKRKKLRLKKHAQHVHLPTPLVRMRRSKRGGWEAHLRVQPSPFRNSRGILKEFSLLAGEAVAATLDRAKIPAAFVSQDAVPPTLDFEPTNDPLEDRIRQEALDKLKKKDAAPETIIEQIKRLRALPVEVVSIHRAPHYGYGLSGYAPFHNPTEKYLDLVNQHQLKAALLEQAAEIRQQQRDEPEEAASSSSQLDVRDVAEGIIPSVEARQQEVDFLVKNSTRFWILHSIQQDLRDAKYAAYRALVLTSRDDRNEALVLLRHYELEARMTVRRQLTKGELIYVRVEHVDPFYDRLILKEYRPDADTDSL